MTTIVVPLDGSEQAEQALPWAAELSRRIGGGLLLVSIVEIPVEFSAWSATGALAVGQMMDSWIVERNEYLKALGAKIDGVAVETDCRVGSPTSEVLSIIAGVNNPLVVMTSHGRGGVGRLVLGSVANRIVRDAQCPVLVIRASSEAATAEPAFGRVLVPLDGSEFAEDALNRGVEAISASDQQPALHLVRVVEMPVISMPGPDVALDYGLVAEYTDAIKEEAGQYLKRMTETLRARGIDVTSEVLEGNVADAILDSAKRNKSDIIVMSTHGRGGISRLFFGSVAEKVLHSSELPLLLVRPQM